MDITRYVDALRRELAVAAAAGGAEAEALAERLTAPLESAIRLTLLDALSAAAAEITRDLAPGSVHVRLRGQDPDFVVTPQPEQTREEQSEPSAAPQLIDDKSTMTRINLRITDDLKNRVEEAANREMLSINAWLVRAVTSAVDRSRAPRLRAGGDDQHFKGWVR